MVNKKVLGLIVVVILVAAVAVAALQMNLFQPAPSAEARPIKIGLVACYNKAEGQDMDRAAKLAVEEINAAGGIYVSEWHTKVPIELVEVNTEDDTPAKAVSPVTQAVTETGVDLLIGGYTSAGTLANQVVAIEHRVPYIITGASSNLVTRRGPQANYGGLPEGDTRRIDDAEGMSYMFHYCTTTGDYSKTVVNFFAEKMKPLLDDEFGFAESRKLRLAILYRDDAFGKGVVSDSKSLIQSNNLPIEVVAERAYPTTATTFQTDLTAVKAAKPDAVYVVDFIANTAEIIKEGQRDVGLNTVYIAVECCEDPQFYTLLGNYGDKQLLESKFAPYAGPPYYLPMITTYVASYQQKYNTLPGMMGADTYDAFYIAKDAIERAGSVDKAKVRDALESTAMDQMLIMTQTGKIQFSTGTNYHEISAVTFIEQLVWNATLGECRSVIVYPETAPVVGTLKQADFVLPEGYQPGST
ncbi:MAG: ABC transporter substrate-binding protein [Candidatus Bathyarchaeota archaeon]|nr:ABC transporter substrate-binding protein [Candidatus Bathyarchaeota archaeon]